MWDNRGTTEGQDNARGSKDGKGQLFRHTLYGAVRILVQELVCDHQSPRALLLALPLPRIGSDFFDFLNVGLFL